MVTIRSMIIVSLFFSIVQPSQEQCLVGQQQQLEVEKELLSHALTDKTAELQLQTSKTEVSNIIIPTTYINSHSSEVPSVDYTYTCYMLVGWMDAWMGGGWVDRQCTDGQNRWMGGWIGGCVGV